MSDKYDISGTIECQISHSNERLICERNEKKILEFDFDDFSQLLSKDKNQITFELKKGSWENDKVENISFLYVPTQEELFASKEKKGKQTDYQSCMNVIREVNRGKMAKEFFCMVPKLLLVSPRGRYNLGLYTKYMKMEGRSNDFTIQLQKVRNIHFFETSDNMHNIFIRLNEPLLKGKQIYFDLVFKLSDKEQKIKFNVPDAEISKYSFLDEEGYVSGNLQNTLPEILKSCYSIPIVQPSQFIFECGPEKYSYMKGTFNANSGFVHVFNDCILFLPTPILGITINNIHEISFTGISNNSEYFHMSITVKDPKLTSMKKNVYDFSYLPRKTSFVFFSEYCRKLKINAVVANIIEGKTKPLDDNESDSEEFQPPEESEISDEISEENNERLSKPTKELDVVF